jgi:TonB-dependent receptor
MNRKIIILFLSLLMGAGSLWAQSGSISGSVFDPSLGEGLAAANVILEGTKLGASTDLNGNYIIHNVPEGTYTLRASYIGYSESDTTVIVRAHQDSRIHFTLNYGNTIEGETIVVTAQVSGQLAAINEQLSSNRIVNTVSAEKMEELPDANAAESIGRLPGVSLQRSAGEANRIVIRGLSPKYNSVTIEGVKVSSTNDYDRSVDLDIMQGEMLAGVEVSKSLQANMDADAIGGTVNLKLREAPQAFHFKLNALGGYNGLDSELGNYKILGAVSDRFFDEKFGARLQLSVEEKQLPSHQFGGSYSQPILTQSLDSLGNLSGSSWQVRTNGTVLTDITQVRGRIGGSLILDYKSDFADFKLYNLYNNKTDDAIQRQNKYTFTSPSMPFSLNISKPESETELRTHSLQSEFNLIGTEFKTKLSYTRASNRGSWQNFNFIEQSSGTEPINPDWLIFRQPADVLKLHGQTYVENSYLTQMLTGIADLKDENYDYLFDWDIPFNISPDLTGKIAIGGKYHRLERKSEVNTEFVELRYGAGRSGRSALVEVFPWIDTNLDSQYGVSAINFMDANYNPGVFLDGRYELGWTADADLLNEVQNQIYSLYGHIYERNGYDNYHRDYANREDIYAAYIMSQLDIGNNLRLMPGLRYEKEKTGYDAYHIELLAANRNGILGTPKPVHADRENENIFPSINLKYKFNNWGFVQGAVYKSTSRPSFRLLSPLVVLSENANEPFTSGNPYLKPSTAWNYDLGVTVHDSNVGLLTLNLFYKEVTNFVFIMNKYYPRRNDRIIGAPDGFLSSVPGMDYYLFDRLEETHHTSIPMNNFDSAIIRGLEFSWQTHFWYLPGLLSGLVLDANLTLIKSETSYPYFESIVIGIDSSGFFPRDIIGYKYRTRRGKLVDQPDAILNLILGWDYKDFSSRVSSRFQGRTVNTLDSKLQFNDSFYDVFFLVDVSLKQGITDKLSVYANLTNIGNHIDDYFNEYSGNIRLPTRSEHYGFRAQFGVSYDY